MRRSVWTFGGTGSIKDADRIVGNRTKAKVVKNKVAPPFREAEFDIMYGEGISHEGELLDLAVGANIVDKSGSWFSYDSERLGQGRENAKQFLKENPEYYARMEEEVRVSLGLGLANTTPAVTGTSNGKKR